MADAFHFGELELARVRLEAASDWIAERARKRRICVIVTSNINHLRLAEIHPRFAETVRRSELNLADGWPLVFASRILGCPLPERVAGVDLVAHLLTSRTSFRLALLGGGPSAAERLAQRLGGSHKIVLARPLPSKCWEEDGALESLKSALEEAEPNLVLLGVSPPHQELLAEELRSAVRGAIICCGGTLEVLAGLRARAPVWMQKAGFEWAFRVALEPRRLAGRYAVSGVAFVRVLAHELSPSGREGVAPATGTRP